MRFWKVTSLPSKAVPHNARSRRKIVDLQLPERRRWLLAPHLTNPMPACSSRQAGHFHFKKQKSLRRRGRDLRRLRGKGIALALNSILLDLDLIYNPPNRIKRSSPISAPNRWFPRSAHPHRTPPPNSSRSTKSPEIRLPCTFDRHKNRHGAKWFQ